MSVFFAGFSVFQLFGNDIGVDALATGKNVRHYFGMLGYKLDVNDHVCFIPSVLVKNASHASLSLDLNGKVFIDEKYWVGVNYRYEDSFSAFVGMLIANSLEVSYAYDAITSALRKHSSGSHELLVGYRINKGHRLVSPSDYW